MYKIEKHVFDNFTKEGIIIDDIEWVVYSRPWWRFWEWTRVKSFEYEYQAKEYVRLEKGEPIEFSGGL